MKYGAQSADRSARYACCRRQFQLAGVARPTWLTLSSQGHFFSVACYFFAGRFTRDPRLSTGSGALQPRVESRTPPKKLRFARDDLRFGYANPPEAGRANQRTESTTVPRL